jgi:glycosyltransferase involved in cell wall biosynthesis
MAEVRPLEPPAVQVLYITYDGLLEPLGRSQVLPYLLELAKAGVRSAVVSFEKPTDTANRAAVGALRAELEGAGIVWRALPYHKRPRALVTAWDVVRGVAAGWSLSRRHRPAIVHARSYVAGLIGLAVKTLSGARFVFDMRGFWPEERVELGLFRQNGLGYRLSKLAEETLLASADHVVVLTENAKSILRGRQASAELRSRRPRETPLSVVPCCVDLERYGAGAGVRDVELARAHGLDSSVVIGNVGAFSPRYMTYEMFRFACHVKSHRPEARFVYLTHHASEPVRKAARNAGLRDEDVLVLRVEPADVPRWLSLFRLGVFFLRPSYAAKASSFTKLGEFLAAGVPVVTNTGVGDVDRLLGSERCGLLLSGLTDRDLAVFARKALPLLDGAEVPAEIRRNCLAAAKSHFALEDGVRRYRTIYDSLAASGRAVERAGVAAETG